MFTSNLLRIFCIIWFTWLMKGCRGLEAPKLESVTGTDEGGIFVTWKPVNSSLDNSILGYKIIIYEVKEKTARMFKLVNADQQPGLVVEERTDEIIIYEVKEKTARMFKLVNADQQPGLVVEERTDEVFGTIPLRLAKQILAEGANTENIVIDYIKPNSLHEIRVLSYTKDKESKMSEPWRVKLFKDSNIQGVAHRHLNQCVLTIRSQDIATDTPDIYNNYI